MGSLNEGDILKKRMATEKTDLEKQIHDGENQLRNLNKMKVSLQNQLEDMRRLAESETRDKATLVGKFKSLETDLENLRERLEEENQIKGDIQKQLSKAVADAQIWKAKYD